jgi:arsenite methyltransferase
MALYMIDVPALQAGVRSIRAAVERCADRILDAAQLAQGMRLADIGTGEGLIAFRAIRRVGPALDVLLTEACEHMLQQTASLAFQHQVHGQCAFLHCAADQLDG